MFEIIVALWIYDGYRAVASKNKQAIVKVWVSKVPTLHWVCLLPCLKLTARSLGLSMGQMFHTRFQICLYCKTSLSWTTLWQRKSVRIYERVILSYRVKKLSKYAFLIKNFHGVGKLSVGHRELKHYKKIIW